MQRTARLVVIGIALVAGLGAALLASGSKPPPAPVVIQQASEPQIKTLEVLSTSAELPIGSIIQTAQLEWKKWPEEGISPFAIRRSEKPDAITEYAGSIVRVALLQGEPVRADKLIKPDGSGFMSAILPSGLRALAVPIDNRGTNSAGGFILPNDRVDVIRTMRDELQSKSMQNESFRADTILTNVRVLAVGQTVQERNGEKTVTGEHATLELTPQQVEGVLLALRVGTLTLSLRSIVDRNEPTRSVEGTTKEGELSVVRFGVVSTR